jgi:protein subunit release factor A
VRVVHLPTGTSASAEDEVNIAANRELALTRLADLLGEPFPRSGQAPSHNAGSASPNLIGHPTSGRLVS